MGRPKAVRPRAAAATIGERRYDALVELVDRRLTMQRATALLDEALRAMAAIDTYGLAGALVDQALDELRPPPMKGKPARR